MFTLSTPDAAILLAVVSGITATVVAWLRTVAWAEWVKFLVAIAFSGVAGALTAYIGGGLRVDVSLLSNLAVVYTAGRLFYFAVFQVLGLEKILLPKAALNTEARAQADAAVASFSVEQAKQVVASDTGASLKVDTTIVG